MSPCIVVHSYGVLPFSSVKIGVCRRKMSKLSSLSPPRRRVEKGRDWHRWTRNSLLRTIKPFLAEFPAALDHGIDICVAVHVCRHENVEVPGNLTLLTYTYDGPFNA